MARITIKDAKELAKRRGLTHCIIFGCDSRLQHVQHIATYGRTLEQAAQAAEFGNQIKKSCGWPDRLCHAEPARVRRLQAQIRELKDRIAGACV